MRTKRNTVREFTTNRLHEQVSEFWNENWMDLYDAKILWHDAMVATCWMRWLQSDTILNWTINYILDLLKLPGRMNWHDRFQNSPLFLKIILSLQFAIFGCKWNYDDFALEWKKTLQYALKTLAYSFLLKTTLSTTFSPFFIFDHWFFSWSRPGELTQLSWPGENSG